MQRSPTTGRRALALFLCVQPVLWTGRPALAQAIEQQAAQIPSADLQRVQQAQAQAQGETARTLPSLQGASPAAGATPGVPAPFGAGLPGDPEGVRGERPGSLPAATPLDEPLDPDRYVLGPGDVLELRFWGIENFRQRVAVDLEGRAFVPKVGYLVARGKTLAEAQRILRDTVARLFPRLGFGVSLAEPRTFLVQAVGDVARPGSQTARAIERVSTVVARAGGIGPNGSRRRIEVRRLDGTQRTADLLLYALGGDVKHNPYVLDGDVIRVPYQEVAVTAGGAVNRPGKYELTGTTDLPELAMLAGGLAPGATRGLPITLVRRAADDRLVQSLVSFPADGALPGLRLERDDSVWFPGAAELQQAVSVVGAIAGAGVTQTGTTPDESSSTRRLPWARGDTVRTVLERVGGTGPLADLKGAYIVRDGNAHPVDLHALVMLRDLAADRPLELGDTLVVPFQRRNVLVEGAVFRPGPYAFNPSHGVEQYLSLAGGRNRFAQSLEDVYVVTPQGETHPYAPNLKVAPGSSVVVPERSFSRSEVASLLLTAASVLLSGVAVVITARK